MNVYPIDPRDARWERKNPRYRVYFWENWPNAPFSGWVSDEWEIEGADVSEALGWAQRRANGRSFVLYACITSSEGLGLVRLLGIDPLDEPSDNPPDHSAHNVTDA